MAKSTDIALITDSGTNVPQKLLEHYGIYCAYLMVNYRDAQYREVLEISTEEVLARFDEELPKTSTPSPQDVADCVERAIADGHTRLLCVTTSSGLSSTYMLFRSVLSSHPDIEYRIIDSKNIGSGAGIGILYAAELIDRETLWEELGDRVQAAVDRTSVYFLVDTLDNLYHGGRINKAVYSLGSMLNLKPVITCGANGTYEVVEKARGRAKALKKELDLVRRDIGDAVRYRIGFATCATPDRAEILARLKEAFPHAERIDDYGEVSPALAVHTGTGLVGVTVQVLA